MSKSKAVADKYRDFLLSFFQGDFYQEKEVNGFWLTKNWDGNKNQWCVYVFTRESFRAYKNAGMSREEFAEQNIFLSQIT